MEPAERPRLSQRWPLGTLSTVVVCVTLAASIGSAYLAKRVVDDQENRLLRERTAEVAALYTVAISSTQASLASAAAVASATGADPKAFTRYAKTLLLSTANPNGYAALALVSTSGAAARLVAAVGSGVTTSHLALPEVARNVTRAVSASFVSTPVLHEGTDLRLGFALGPPTSPPGFVVYAEQTLLPYATVDAPRAANTPFTELVGVIYGSATPDPSQVLQSSVRKVPVRGSHVERQTIPVGPDKWLIEIRARGSLVGGVASAMPWVLLGLGLALALVITAVVEVLARRRGYAEALVEERTQELRTSFEQLEEAQHQLVLSERLAAIGQVASTVGHELRNPLGVMANAVYLLRLRIDDPSATRQLDLLDRELQSAARISSDLLDFARTREPTPRPVDLNELVTESLSVVARPSGVEVMRRDATDIGSVAVDRDQLRQVLINLISNAFEALSDGGTVTVSIERLDGAVRIEVADDGPGIDEDTKARVFEPFFSTKARGTGLGLAVCKRLVEAHGGVLAVASAPGEGARFAVVLPRIPTATPAPSSESPAPVS